MANEITMTGSLSYLKNRARAALSGSATVDQAGDHYVQQVQDVGTAEEQLEKGDIATIGWCAFRNMDATNYVELGATAGVYSMMLDPGEFIGPMRWSGSAIYAKA